MSGEACGICGGRGEVYDGPRIVWRPCPMCAPAVTTPPTTQPRTPAGSTEEATS